LKKAKKQLKKQRKRERRESLASEQDVGRPATDEEAIIGPTVPDVGVGQAMKPMTKEEWERQQNEVRRVVDEDTGRTRLVRGRGEIIEQVVSPWRQAQINKQATKADGEYFQKTIAKQIASQK